MENFVALNRLIASHSRLVGEVTDLLQSRPETRLSKLGLEISFIILRLDNGDWNSRARSLCLTVSRDIRLDERRKESSLRLLHIIRVEGKSTDVLLKTLRRARAQGWGNGSLRNSSLLEEAESQEGLCRASNRSHFSKLQGGIKRSRKKYQ
jgi:hypothetical protein